MLFPLHMLFPSSALYNPLTRSPTFPRILRLLTLSYAAPSFLLLARPLSHRLGMFSTRLAFEVETTKYGGTICSVQVTCSPSLKEAPDLMTIRRLSIGAGYKYLLKSIAVGDGPEGTDKSDLVRYYSETGTPPGVFLGAGLVGLDDGVALTSASPSPQRTSRGCSRTAPIPSPARCSAGLRARRRVGGFDLTFSPSKSVSVAWALADRETREVIYRCHQEAIAEVLAYAEREVFHTRSGKQGCVEEDIVGSRGGEFHPLRFSRRRSPTPRPRGRAQPGPSQG